MTNWLSSPLVVNNDDDNEPNISAKINWIDYLAIGLYFALIFVVGIWTAWKSKKNTVDGYFLGGRSMHWIPVGASLFASNVGSEHFVGLAGSGASSGIAIVAFEYNAMLVLLLLGWYFLPVYLSSNVSTMPEYLQKRFGGQRIRVYLSLLTLILYIFTKISADLYAGALFIKLLLNLDDIYVAICILLAVSAFFTIIGGMSTVMWTDSVQLFLMVIGAIALSIISFVRVGGYEQLVHTFPTKGVPIDPKYQSYKYGCNGSVPENNCESCSAITPYYLNLFRPATDNEMPWPGLIGIFVSAIWYWCTDQVIVQRVLAAKNLTHAKAGCLAACMLKLLPMFMLILPGMIARVLWPNQIGCSDPDYCEQVCGSRTGCTNMAYPYLVMSLMPQGATGLMVSVILAALMSSLSSIFNSASTIFTIDIYTRFRNRATEIEQVIMGRFFVVVLVVVSVAWVPVIATSQNSELFQYIQSITSFLAPPLCSVFMLSIFWNGITEQGAFWSLILGLLIGMVRMILEFAIPAPGCSSTEPDRRPYFVSKIHYLHFGMLLWLVSAIIAVSISFFTKKPDPKQLYRLTFYTIHNEEVRQELEQDMQQPNGNSSTSDSNKLGDNWKWLAFICAVQSNDSTTKEKKDDSSCENGPKLTPEELAKIDARAAIDDPKWSHLINLSAVIVIMVCGFFWGFYA